MAEVTITGLKKSYGLYQAVKGIDLMIPHGEFTVLVGPSGCGKTTLLRAIAGLESISDGTIAIGGEVVNDMRPRDRDVAMVFQDYALYPHMSVRRNIGFGLKARKFPPSDIERRVARAAAMLGIESLMERLPRHLSGGQRQRVAIGRAIVRDPQLFLFDEPLSNLDAQLRDDMRSEIKRLHQEIATTMIYVTHDQIEAMTLADRIVLMRDGRIEQQGTPLDLFERPATRFVAGFLGSPKMNFLDGQVVPATAGLAVRLDGSDIVLPLPPERSSRATGAVTVGIRPEHVSRANGATHSGMARFETAVDLIQPTGPRAYATVRCAGQPLVAELQAHDTSPVGTPIALDIDLRRMAVFDRESGHAV